MPDTTPPTIAITSNKTALKAGDTALITFTLSEGAFDFVLSDITVTGGTLSNFAGSGLNYSATFKPNSNSTSQGLVSVGNFKFSDAAGNANEDGVDANNLVSFIVDTIPPMVRISSPRTYLGINDTPTITFTLSEPSTNFDISDISITGGTLSAFKGSGVSYSAVFTPASTKNLVVSVLGNRFTDDIGNSNTDYTQISLTPYDATKGNVVWSRLLGTSEADETKAIATGTDGSVYVCGITKGSLDGQLNYGDWDIFITKYNIDGTKVWTRLLGTSTGESAYALTIGLDGFIYLSGTSSGSIDGQTNIGVNSDFITKYSPDGNKVWTRYVGSNGVPYALTTGIDGFIYIGGSANTSRDGIVGIGSGDALLTKYSADGAKVWTRLFGSKLSDYIQGMTTGLDGSIYVCGSTWGSLDDQPNSGQTDAFISKFSADGTKVWTSIIRTSGYDFASALTSGLDGSIYLSGYAGGSIDGQYFNGGGDALLIKFNPDGTKAWTRLLGSTSYDRAYGLTTGMDGTIFLSGYTLGSFDDQENKTYSDSFLTQFSTDGTKLWTRFLGINSSEGSYGLTTGLDGAIYFGGGTSSSLDGLANSGGNGDAYVVKFVVPDTSTPKISVSSTKTLLNVGETDEISFVLNKPSTNFALSDIAVQGGLLSNFKGSGVNYFATFTAGSDGQNGALISVGSGKFSDALGIFNEDGADANNKVSFTVTVPADNTPPTISVSSNKTNLHGGDTAALTFTLSEASTNFVASDITVVGGTLSNFTGSGTSYTATFTPAADSSMIGVISVPSGVFTDSSGNSNADGFENNNSVSIIQVVKDLTPPSPISFSPSLGEKNVDVSRNIVITFNEKIQRGTGVIDIRLGHPTLGNLLESFNVATSDRLTYDGTTLTINPTRDLKGNYYLFIYLADDAVQDSAGNKSVNISYYTITTANQTTTENYSLSVVVNKGVLGAEPVLLKDLTESFVFENGYTKKHIVEYAGSTFDYNQIDSLIMTVTRDGEFTEEFSREINDYLGKDLNITYPAAVTLVGAASIDAVILAVAGADGNYVG